MKRKTAEKMDRHFPNALALLMLLAFILGAWPAISTQLKGRSKPADEEETGDGAGDDQAVARRSKDDPKTRKPPLQKPDEKVKADNAAIDEITRAEKEAEKLEFTRAINILWKATELDISDVLKAQIKGRIAEAKALRTVAEKLPCSDIERFKMKRIELGNATSLVCLNVAEEGDTYSISFLSGGEVTVKKDKVESMRDLTKPEKLQELEKRLDIFSKNVKVTKPSFGPYEQYRMAVRAMELGLKKKALNYLRKAWEASPDRNLRKVISLGEAERMYSEGLKFDNFKLIVEAEAKYKEVIEKYPRSQYAKNARDMLDAMAERKKAVASAGMIIKRRPVRPVVRRKPSTTNDTAVRTLPIRNGGMTYTSSALSLTAIRTKNASVKKLLPQADAAFIKGYDEYVKGRPGPNRDYGKHLKQAVKHFEKASNLYCKAQDIEDNDIVDYRLTHVYKFMHHALRMTPGDSK